MPFLGFVRSVGAKLLVALALLCALALAIWSPGKATAQASPNQGPGGPVLVITSSTAPFGSYYAEILRSEGLNAFAVADISTVSAATLASYDVVILAKVSLNATQVSTLTTWVNGGGNLIAMAPDGQLASLLGLTSAGTTLSNGYLLVDTSKAPGNGIVGQTMQFHGTADRYTLNGATSVATLYSNATTPTSNPAITLRNVGSGKAAAFTYDLATSIVYTRQGNPAWATQERDGFAPIRSDDKFYGASASDPQADWVDLNKVSIPQADEQQRLLANLIQHMNLAKKPIPRFWYFPNDKKAVVLMTGDDHGNNGTAGRFDIMNQRSPAGCSVDNWECLRGTSYIFTSTPMSNAEAAAYNAQGHEVGIHINTGCADYTQASLATNYTTQIAEWQSKYSSLPAPVTMRHHCIAWSDWTSAAVVQRSNGIRLDTSYYFWPPSWANNTPGVFTGSAMPMRFAALDGTLIDVYQAATQMTDESGQAYPYTVDTLLDRALGPEGYYGAYVVNAHTDVADIVESDTVITSALARNVPVISSRQLLTWLDGRNSSTFSSMSWASNALTFTVTRGSGANGLRGMLPLRTASRALSTLTRSGSPVPFTVRGIKGVEYAFFSADAGTYVASYAADTAGPTVASTAPASGATGVAVDSSVRVTFNEAIDPATLNASTFELRNAANAIVPATLSYDAGTRTAVLTPTAALAATSSFTATVRGGATDPRIKDPAANALAAALTWSFTTAAPPVGPTCPCTAWGTSAVPATPSAADPNPVELGVKFRSDVSGFITGVRFYKGSANTGTHVGNLWSLGGQLLASATFAGETSTGWQQVNFATPVAVTANTVYVASYFAPNGGYAINANFFAGSGVDNAPIHLLRDGVSGGNGVYAYSGSTTFPNESWNASNYWVDVVFSTTGPADTTPPTVTTTVPAAGASGVSSATTVAATFSEAMDAATINGTTFELRAPGNALVTASVTYNPSTLVATLTPSAALAASTTYTATVRGGSSGVKDAAGNALAANLTWTFTTAPVGGACGTPANPIVGENCLPGNPASEWDISGVGDTSIQGYATQISVNRGSTVSFKVDTNASAYRFDIYRMGYYGGLGARKIATVLPSATLPQNQPDCLNDTASGLIDCGNWAVSGSWAVPATAVSGIYFAKVVRTDNGGASHIFFIVRNDASTSHMVFQTSDTTWQAYNTYGGNSFYTGQPAGRAYKVSYNRPFNTRIVDNGQDWVFNAEYPMVRWLEANGYDVSYISGVDTDRAGSLLLNHRAFLSVGHDEYWSGPQRANVEAARNAGVHLAFFSGNEVFWKTRWENSIDGSGTPYRTLVSYKETHANAKIDPTATWTGTWRDPRFSPPSDGGRPENALTGTMFAVNIGTSAISVPEADGKMRFWRNTSVATLSAGAVATMPNGTLGYEWDVDADNGSRPAGLIRMSSTTVSGVDLLQDLGSTYAPGTATHNLTLYKHASGARVFGAGTIQWSWGLDAVHDRAGPPADIRMQQATVNLFADMNVQPATLQVGLVPATMTTDTVAPTSAITAPTTGSNVAVGGAVTITGTASDTGGVVGGVEVSVDGGTTWRRANGRANWTYTWTPSASGNVTIRSRAADDSGNLESPSAGVTVTVGGAASCPCSIWPASAVPTNVSDPESASVNLGVKFRSDVDGFISGIRFYKGAANTGTHIGALWSSGGALLAQATFTGETSSGWQQVNFATPVAITANTVYVASYLAPNGRYAGDTGYFATAGVDNGPLHALQNGVSGGNGVYVYGSSLGFPNQTWNSANYWVDVVLTTTPPADTTPPTVTGSTPPSGASGVARNTTVTATFSEAMTASTINASTIELRGPGTTLVTATVSYDAATRVATLTPSALLAASTVYTASVRGGSTDPRVKDSAGNALAANSTWTFTTAAVDATPPTVSTVTPTSGSSNVPRTTTVTATFSEAMDASTINANTIELRGPGTTLVTSAVSYNATTRVATLTPGAQLAASTLYTATVRGGSTDPRVKDVAGNALAANSTWTFTTAAADTTPPTVAALAPASGASGVAASGAVTMTFSESMDAASVNTSTVELRGPGATLVTSTVAYNASTFVATLTPSAPLTASTLYTVTVRGGASDPRVRDVAGNAMAANSSWSFTTASGPACPCNIWPASAVPTNPADSDTVGVNLGVKFRANIAGYIRGIRYYKSSTNTGTHVGALWSSTGTLLAQATFTGETTSGWQQVNFATPVAITAGTVYVASYLAPNGRYAGDNNYFTSAGVTNGPLEALQNGVSGGNGVYAYGSSLAFPSSSWNSSNYWVDVVFSTTP